MAAILRGFCRSSYLCALHDGKICQNLIHFIPLVVQNREFWCGPIYVNHLYQIAQLSRTILSSSPCTVKLAHPSQSRPHCKLQGTERLEHHHCFSTTDFRISSGLTSKLCLSGQNYPLTASKLRYGMTQGDKSKRSLTTLVGGEDSSLEEVATVVLQATEKVDVMAASLLPSTVEHLICDLLSLGFDLPSCRTVLSGRLWLLRQPQEMLLLCQLLLDHGLTPTVVCTVVQAIPFTLQKELHSLPSVVNSALLILRNFGFSEREILSLLKRDSSVLFMEDHSLRIALARIKSFFPAADTKKVVWKSPNVLSDDWQLVQEKFDYAIWTMGYIQTDILKSHLFSHSLEHIKDRHVFLLRANVFKPVNKKLHPSLNPNPALKLVVDSSDSSFVELVEGVSVEDYSIFCEMRAVEREAETEEWTDDGVEMENQRGRR